MNTAIIDAAAQTVGSLRMRGSAIPGQGRLVDGLGRLACWIGGDRAVTAPWPGVRFETDLTDRIQRQMWSGIYEPHVRDCFGAILEPGNVYFDVGAHIGYHAVFAANRVGHQGRVLAFEADPRVFERLSRNLAQFHWARAVHAAVWDRTGSLTFERSSTANESGWGTVGAVRDFGTGEHLEVSSVALDDFARSASLSRWDAMKLDAEGSELAVLRGAGKLLESFHPVLVLEINGTLLKYAGTSGSAVVSFLRERGYSLFVLQVRRLEPWDAARHADFCDALCIHEARLPEVLERLANKGFRILS